jgi:hypothetical protein
MLVKCYWSWPASVGESVDAECHPLAERAVDFEANLRTLSAWCSWRNTLITPDSSFLDLFELLAGAFALVFILWPLVVLMPLRGRGRLLPQMLVFWSFLAVGRVLLFFKPVSISFSIIPEPYNTMAFFATGAVL